MKPVNLLPDEHRPRRAGGERPGSAYAVLGVLAVALAMVGFYVLSANQVSSREDAAAQAQRDAQAAQAEIATLGAFANFSQIKQVRVASVTSLAEARFDWERFVRELALVLPGRTYLSQVDASVLPDAAATATAATATTAIGPSATLLGCAPRQPDVAQLMVRLRELYRVQDVSLTESAKGSSDSASDSGDCGSFYSFSVIVAFTPSAPVVDGAGRRVPASLGGGG